MNKFTEYVSSQFGNPKGFGGHIITFLQNVINRKMYNNVVKYIDADKCNRVLDIGYGNGYLISKIYMKCNADMYGIDISEDAMTMAIKKNKKANEQGKLHLGVGDCCALPYDSEMFDCVTSINTIYFWSDTVKGLSEIRRTLKTGGSFYNVVYTKEYLDKVKYTQIGYRKFLADELINFGYEAGFVHIEIQPIVEGDSFAVVYMK